MPDETRAPKLHDGAYLIKKALTRTLREIHPPDGDLTLLDIG